LTSKDYTIIALQSGENAWQMFGAKTPPVVEYLFGYYYGSDRSVTAQQQGRIQLNKPESKNGTDLQRELQRGSPTRPVVPDNDGNIMLPSEVMAAEWSPECLAAVDAVTEKYKAHAQAREPGHRPATETQVMPTTGLNHDDDVKQSKKVVGNGVIPKHPTFRPLSRN
jgi:hypothetical protein